MLKEFLPWRRTQLQLGVSRWSSRVALTAALLDEVERAMASCACGSVPASLGELSRRLPPHRMVKETPGGQAVTPHGPPTGARVHLFSQPVIGSALLGETAAGAWPTVAGSDCH